MSISYPNPALELLHAGVMKLLESGTWRDALAFRAKFHGYSFNNVWLIYLQCPTATLVAGYKRWQDLGRQVRKGETSLAILAPIKRKLELDTGEEVVKVVGFKTARVFDVSQTDGAPIPSLPRPALLAEDSPLIQTTLVDLHAFANAQGFPIKHVPSLGGALGSFSLSTRQITLCADLPPLQSVKTLVHELAHALMHAHTTPTERARHTLELEAESCAFLVCHALGLDTSRYSFAYLASWTEDPAELLPAAERACRAADTLLAFLTPTPIELEGVAA